MTNTPHMLSEEFPGQSEVIHWLKGSDPAFARLIDSLMEGERALSSGGATP